MVSRALAEQLRAAGLAWRPESGDRFQLLGGDMEGAGTDLFTVSDMTIEPHRTRTGIVLGFNGTTEWALDSVALVDALWFPREDQLRDALGSTFVVLERQGGGFAVVTGFRGARQRFEADRAADAYALALLDQVRAATT